MSSKALKTIDLSLSFDIVDDNDKVYNITYRPLTNKELKAKPLLTIKKYYADNFNLLTTLVSTMEGIRSDHEDMEKVIEMTPKEDDDYADMLREKVKLSSALRKATAELVKETKIVKDKHESFTNLTSEYGKIALAEMQKQVGGVDGEAVLKLAKSDLENATLMQMLIKDLYKKEFEGK